MTHTTKMTIMLEILYIRVALTIKINECDQDNNENNYESGGGEIRMMPMMLMMISGVRIK